LDKLVKYSALLSQPEEWIEFCFMVQREAGANEK